MDIKRTIKKQSQTLFRTGFFHIVGAGTINKILITVLGLVVVRLMTKSDYGIYAYANSIITILVAFNGLGIVSSILQVCSELAGQNTEAEEVFSYGYRWGVIVDVLLGASVAVVAIFVPLAIHGSNNLLVAYSFYPLLVLLCEIKQTQLRVTFRNKEYAYSTNLQTVLTVTLSLVGIICFGALGLIIGQELSLLVTYIVLCVKYPSKREKTRAHLEKRKKIDIWKIALTSTYNGGTSFALTLSGTQIIGLMMSSDSLVATYQVATLIPFGLLFIPGAITTYVYPYFAKNRNNRNWTIATYKKLLLGCFAVSTVIAVTIWILAEPICVILFGNEYLDAVPALRVLMVGFWLTGSFRQVTGNLLVTQRKLISNSVVGTISAVACIGVCVWLVPCLGIVGAAFSYVAAMLIGAVANVILYCRTIKKIP